MRTTGMKGGKPPAGDGKARLDEDYYTKGATKMPKSAKPAPKSGPKRKG